MRGRHLTLDAPSAARIPRKTVWLDPAADAAVPDLARKSLEQVPVRR